jgi:hypothetical protein
MAWQVRLLKLRKSAFLRLVDDVGIHVSNADVFISRCPLLSTSDPCSLNILSPALRQTFCLETFCKKLLAAGMTNMRLARGQILIKQV